MRMPPSRGKQPGYVPARLRLGTIMSAFERLYLASPLVSFSFGIARLPFWTALIGICVAVLMLLIDAQILAWRARDAMGDEVADYLKRSMTGFSFLGPIIPLIVLWHTVGFGVGLLMYWLF